MSGFRDFLPEMMIPRERLMETARQVYRAYGFSPIDTPTLEYAEILTGKGSDETDRQMYRFQQLDQRSNPCVRKSAAALCAALCSRSESGS